MAGRGRASASRGGAGRDDDAIASSTNFCHCDSARCRFNLRHPRLLPASRGWIYPRPRGEHADAANARPHAPPPCSRARSSGREARGFLALPPAALRVSCAAPITEGRVSPRSSRRPSRPSGRARRLGSFRARLPAPGWTTPSRATRCPARRTRRGARVAPDRASASPRMKRVVPAGTSTWR